MDDIEALRMARVQLQVRYTQLSSCRVCGVEAARYEQAIERLKIIEANLKENHYAVPVQQAQS